MKRQSLTLVTVVLLVSLGACSGGGSDEDPKASPSKAPSAAPATTIAPPPQPPAQPTGANGVTYEIANWDQYATDPAVLAWKQTLEGVGGSVGARKVLAPVTTGMSKRVLRPYVQSLENAWKGGWTVQPIGKVRIESVTPSGSTKSRIISCQWDPSIVFYEKGGAPVGAKSVKDISAWSKQQVDMRLRGGRWIIATSKFDGECPGGPPS